MAKTKRSAGPPASPPTGNLVIDPFGPMQQRRITQSRIASSVFTLDDGTKIVVKPMVGDIRRAIDQYNLEGQPLYFLSLGSTITTLAPKRLLKDAASKGAKRTSKAGRKKSKGGKS